MAINLSAAAASAANNDPGQQAAERLLRAVEDLSANPAIGRKDTADIIDQAALLLEAGVVGGALVASSIGGEGLLALASGSTTPAAPAAPVVDPKLEAIASSLGRTPDAALVLLEQMVHAISSPVTGAAPVGARGVAAEGAFRGLVRVREDASPAGMVLPDGSVSTGPAPVLPPAPAAGSVSKADHDRVLARIAAFEAARTALDTARKIPDDRKNRARRESEIAKATAKLENA